MSKKLIYKNLTPLEKLTVCNGCGRKGRHIPVPEFKFTASCHHHDFKYWQGGTEADRIKADYEFFEAMLHDAKYKEDDTKRKWVVRQYYKAWAHVYYNAVRLCGGNKVLGGFHYAAKKRTRKDLDEAVEEYLRTSKSRGHVLYSTREKYRLKK